MQGRTKLLLSIIIISAFGPYIFPNSGIRLEHVIIYTLFFFFLLSFYYFRLKMPRILFVLVSLWFIILIWISIITATSGNNYGDYYEVIAAVENLFQPIAIILLMAVIVSNIPQSELESNLLKAANLVVLLLAINTIWIVLGLYVDLTSINIYFWAGRGSEISTVAQRAASMGRYSGIINQPLESGLLYSLGLMCWAYAAVVKREISIVMIVLLVMLVVGGIFSVSKVFLFGGLPIFAIYMLEERKSVLLNIAKYLLIIPLAYVVDLFFNYYWIGYSLLLRFGQAILENRLFQTIFATRYGSEGTGVIRSFIYTWSESPFVGFGFDRHTAYDNSYLEFFMYGGSVALLLYVLILLILLGFSIKNYKKGTRIEAKTLFLLMVFVIIAGTGGPTLIANRFSVLFWVLCCLLIASIKAKSGTKMLEKEVFKEEAVA